ncbi:hypothetical protein Q5762_31400 [Streptomyces sp. P9(2023)]|uniref:hypothetical protein n=1 Tax=Streptomyces sp. P9(2023) TaxID=3064394 RepID=UPI0028F3F7C8|nr:hypothetical protein [Streptomyces sp. P9(2023)]MDT9692753.1 hypothetical protein [Streptomyces sp. P9(2023)]
MTTPPADYDPTRHPDLLAWLTERQAAFEPWAHEAGGVDLFDFSDASLEALGNLIREAFAEMEEVTAQRRTPFVQGAVWYIGETLCRRRGWVWKYQPDINFGQLAPFYGEVENRGLSDTPSVGAPGRDADPEEDLYPLNIVRRVVSPEDILGDPVDECLVGMVEGWYDDEDEEDGEE